MVEILNAHGSKNDIFVVAMRPRDFASESDLHAFVLRLCDRNGPLGADGIYFYDAGPRVPQAWFFNPDGSPAEFCGNGMRCLGRVVLDLRGTDAVTVRSGQREYTVRRGATTAQGVRQISLEHPAVDFNPQVPVVAGRSPLIRARLPELDPALEFTAVTIPNPHLVALIDSYAESGLIAMGERIAARRDVFPVGANLSVLLPLGSTEGFVRTFERGAGSWRATRRSSTAPPSTRPRSPGACRPPENASFIPTRSAPIPPWTTETSPASAPSASNPRPSPQWTPKPWTPRPPSPRLICLRFRVHSGSSQVCKRSDRRSCHG